MRSYDEYCAIARWLGAVGDRWTLLIVRELALRGACCLRESRSRLPELSGSRDEE
jgi:DNA-binding HxlR family transcriptional regulator